MNRLAPFGKIILSIMLLSLLASSLTQTNPIAPKTEEVVKIQELRPLPGHLDAIPVFNSNSPELISSEGILLSTFPPQDKKIPTAHLNFAFTGRFDIFAHHVAKANPPENLRSLYLGIILHNPGKQPIKVNILRAATYLSQPDAPFIDLFSFIPNDLGTIFAGPGDRVTYDILVGKRQAIFPDQMVIPPGQSQMLLNLPIPVQGLTPPINGRSTLIRLSSSGKVYVASLALFARTNLDGSERAPNLAEWENLLDNGDLATPRDRIPTPLTENSPSPKQVPKKIVYGRVAGVARGSEWRSSIVDNPQSPYLTIPQPNHAFSYGLSTLNQGTLGTGQVQSAPMLVRYPDTAYLAHGNYGVQYSLRLPLYNNTQNQQTVTVTLQTPLKENKLQIPGLRFLTTPTGQVFFRGTVRVRYQDEQGYLKTRFIHLVQRRGEQGEPLVSLNMKAGDRSLIFVDFLYPPDATPPQVLTIATM